MRINHYLGSCAHKGNNAFVKSATKLIICTLACISLTYCKNEKTRGPQLNEGDGWVVLFNGKDLDGWTPKIKGHAAGSNWKNTFRADNGILSVDYSEYERFEGDYGHLFYKQPFAAYELQLQYRFVGEQIEGGEGWATKNSGVMIHGQSPESMGRDQEFPVCLEVQLLGGLENGVERPTANLCTPGTHVVLDGALVEEHCVNSSSPTFYGEEWIDLEVKVWNDSLVVHLINGEEVMRYSRPVIGGEYNTMENENGQAVTGGYIALQSESHPVEFRNIRLRSLETD